MEKIDIFRSAILPLRHARVVNIGLYIWPLIEQGRFTDTQLHIKAKCADGSLRECTFSTDADGQSPRVEFEAITNGLPLSRLANQLDSQIFRNDSDNSPPTSYEFYEAAISDDLGAALQSTISDILFVHNAENREEVICVVFVFNNQLRVWSGASAYGNIVAFSEKDFVWPFNVEYSSFF